MKGEVFMKTVNIIAFVLTLFGAINWLLIGLFNWSFLGMFLGYTGIRILYVVYAVAAFWLLGSIAHSMMRRREARRA